MRSALYFACLVAVGCSSAPPSPAPPPQASPSVAPVAEAKPGPITITLVGTNDVHGRIDSLPILEGYLANLRAARGDDGVLVVDAGDMFQGTLESNLAEGVPMVLGYDALHYDAVTLGNHEFDYGPVGPRVPRRARLPTIRAGRSRLEQTRSDLPPSSRRTSSMVRPHQPARLSQLPPGPRSITEEAAFPSVSSGSRPRTRRSTTIAINFTGLRGAAAGAGREGRAPRICASKGRQAHRRHRPRRGQAVCRTAWMTRAATRTRRS